MPEDMKHRPEIITIGAAVILVIVVAALLLLPAVGSKPPGPTLWTRMVVNGFATAATDYKRDYGQYPTAEEGLNALLVNPDDGTWNGPYLQGEGATRNPTDAWQTPLFYSITNGIPAVLSAGPDRVIGTDDDIHSEEQASNNAVEGTASP
jgi:general secretion pathway protein G